MQKSSLCGHFTVIPALPLHSGMDRRGAGLTEQGHRAQGSNPEGRTTKATPGAASWEKSAVGLALVTELSQRATRPLGTVASWG